MIGTTTEIFYINELRREIAAREELGYGVRSITQLTDDHEYAVVFELPEEDFAPAADEALLATLKSIDGAVIEVVAAIDRLVPRP